MVFPWTGIYRGDTGHFKGAAKCFPISGYDRQTEERSSLCSMHTGAFVPLKAGGRLGPAGTGGLRRRENCLSRGAGGALPGAGRWGWGSLPPRSKGVAGLPSHRSLSRGARGSPPPGLLRRRPGARFSRAPRRVTHPHW